MSAPGPARLRGEWTAPLDCPACGAKVACRWVGRKTGTQRCKACGHAFDATWPGFDMEPERVIIEPSGVVTGRGAA